jgi:Uma2 family endonuclease
MPDDQHSEAQARLSAKLVNYIEANPIGRVRTEFTLRLWPEKPTEGRVPDLSIIFIKALKWLHPTTGEGSRTRSLVPSFLPGFSINVQDIFTWPLAPAKSAE